MSMEQCQMYCKGCQRAVLAQRPKVNHILHLLLSILTAGIWIIVWILVSALHLGGWKCSGCGRDTYYFDTGPNGEVPSRVGPTIVAAIIVGAFFIYIYN